MKRGVTAVIFLLLMTFYCQSQTQEKWHNFEWLIGEWKGEGSGQPGTGGGAFTFSYDLDKNIIVRRSHSEYDSGDKKSKVIHDDLMIIYPGSEEKSFKAIYFDNEKHVIEYSVSFNASDNSVILTSNRNANAPVFRLTYTPTGNGKVDTRFEMSPDGVNFNIYIEGISRK